MDQRAEDGRPSQNDAGPIDADGGDASPNDAGQDGGKDAAPTFCDPLTSFGPAVPVASLNSTANDTFARFSPDELTVVFSSDRIDGVSKIYMASRASRQDPFSTPIGVPGLDMVGLNEYAPTLSADRLTVYLHATDEVGLRALYYSTRASTSLSFGPPAMAPGILAPSLHPFILSSGLHVMFTNGTGPFQVLEAKYTTIGQLPVVFGAVTFTNPPPSGFEAAIMSADGKEFFGSNSYDIWRAVRADTQSAFGQPLLAADLSDVGRDDVPDWISPDNCRIYFHRGFVPTGHDIMMASRPSVVP